MVQLPIDNYWFYSIYCLESFAITTACANCPVQFKHFLGLLPSLPQFHHIRALGWEKQGPAQPSQRTPPPHLGVQAMSRSLSIRDRSSLSMEEVCILTPFRNKQKSTIRFCFSFHAHTHTNSPSLLFSSFLNSKNVSYILLLPSFPFKVIKTTTVNFELYCLFLSS